MRCSHWAHGNTPGADGANVEGTLQPPLLYGCFNSVARLLNNFVFCRNSDRLVSNLQTLALSLILNHTRHDGRQAFSGNPVFCGNVLFVTLAFHTC